MLKQLKKFNMKKTIFIIIASLFFLLDAHTQTLDWVSSVGSNSADKANNVCIVNDSLVISVGSITGIVDVNPSASVFNIGISGVMTGYIIVNHINGSFITARSYGGVNGTVNFKTINNSGTNLSVQYYDNTLFICGQITGSVNVETRDFYDLNSTLPVNNQISSAGSNDIIVLGVRLFPPSSNSVQLDAFWVRKIGGTGNDYVSSACTKPGTANGYAATDLFFCGSFSNTVDFDPSDMFTYSLTSAGSTDAFFCTLNLEGLFGSAQRVGGSGLDDGIAVGYNANTNRTTIAGTYEGTINIGLTSVGNKDIFIYTTGYPYKSIGGTGNDYVSTIQPNGSGWIVTGVYTGTTNLYPNAANATNSSPYSSIGGLDGFILCLDTQLGFTWAKSFGGSSNEYVSASSLDNSGNIYLSGRYMGAVDFDPDISTNYVLNSNGLIDLYILKLDNTGIFISALSYGGPSTTENVYSILVDNFDNIFCAGDFSGTVDINPGAPIYNITSLGSSDAYLLKLKQCSLPGAILGVSGPNILCPNVEYNFSINSPNNLLNYIWVVPNNIQIISGQNSNSILLSAQDNSNSNIIEVYPQNTCGLGDTLLFPITIYPNFIVNGGNDQTICQGQSITLNATGATSYSWNNGVTNNTAFTPTATNAYVVVGTDANGCQDSDTVQVTVNPTSTSQLTQTAVGSYTLNGQTYTQSGTYTQVLQNSFGCDSTITLNLTINTSGLSEINSNQISIYPNPATNHININYNGNIEKLEIIDAKGAVVFVSKENKKEYVLPTYLQSGYYMVVIYDHNSEFRKELLISK
jgi:hypothetical protein